MVIRHESWIEVSKVLDRHHLKVRTVAEEKQGPLGDVPGGGWRFSTINVGKMFVSKGGNSIGEVDGGERMGATLGD